MMLNSLCNNINNYNKAKSVYTIIIYGTHGIKSIIPVHCVLKVNWRVYGISLLMIILNENYINKYDTIKCSIHTPLLYERNTILFGKFLTYESILHITYSYYIWVNIIIICGHGEIPAHSNVLGRLIKLFNNWV